MTAQEIRFSKSAVSDEWRWLREIAYQCAVFNERESLGTVAKNPAAVAMVKLSAAKGVDWIIWMLEDLDRRISCLESDSEGRGSDSEGFQRLLQGLKEELKTSE